MLGGSQPAERPVNKLPGENASSQPNSQKRNLGRSRRRRRRPGCNYNDRRDKWSASSDERGAKADLIRVSSGSAGAADLRNNPSLRVFSPPPPCVTRPHKQPWRGTNPACRNDTDPPAIGARRQTTLIKKAEAGLIEDLLSGAAKTENWAVLGIGGGPGGSRGGAPSGTGGL